MTINEVPPTATGCPVTGNAAGQCPVAPSGPKGLPLLGVAPRYMPDPLGYTLRTQERFGSMVRINLPKPFIQVTEPAAVERVLRVNPDNYVRGELYKGFAGFMGRGLLTLNDDEWREHRRVVQPVFAPRRVRADAAEAVSATAAVLRRWAEAARQGSPIELTTDMMDIAGRVIGTALIGRDLAEAGLGYSAAAAFASRAMYTSTVFGPAERLASLLPTRYGRRKRWAHRVLDGIVSAVVTGRGRQGDVGDDAAGLLLASDLPDQAVADNLRTLFLAGSDTTGQALVWTLYELASHPRVREEVEAEVDRVLGAAPPTPELLDALPVVRAAVEEALRLHPPVWQFPRDAVADDELAGRRVPAGSTVLLSAYGTHRSAEHWSDPETFEPNRFLGTAGDGRHRYAYFPFGGGRRMCLGKSLAMATIVTAVAMISQRYQLRLAGGHAVSAGVYITMFARDGVQVIVRERR